MRQDILTHRISGWKSDGVDSIIILVGRPNLAAVGPEVWRHYSWTFNATAAVRKHGSDMRSCSRPVNPKDVTHLARDDYVEPIGAKMIECNPVVVRCEAPLQRRKRRDGT